MTLSPATLTARWPRIPLADAVEFLDHLRKPITASARMAGPYPYYGANGQQDSVADYLFDEPLVLLAEDGGYFDDPARGVAYGVTGKCWVNNHAHVLRPKPDFDFGFLRWHLAHYDVSEFVNGTTRAKLTKSAAERIPLIKPPLPEQRRIAALLDKADAIRRKRKTAIALTEDLLRSTFLEIVGPAAQEYGKWPVRTIESLAASAPNSMRTGPFGSDLLHSEFVDDGIAVLGIDNAVQNRFAWGERRFITPEKYERLRRYTVLPADVIVTIMGTTGRSAVVPDDIPSAITTKHLATITLDRQQAEPEFVSQALFRHPEVLRQIAAANRGAIMSGLNLGLIKALRIPVPPPERQREFARVTTRIRSLASRMDGHRHEEGLFSSLIARAFSGQLFSRAEGVC